MYDMYTVKSEVELVHYMLNSAPVISTLGILLCRKLPGLYSNTSYYTVRIIQNAVVKYVGHMNMYLYLHKVIFHSSTLYLYLDLISNKWHFCITITIKF